MCPDRRPGRGWRGVWIRTTTAAMSLSFSRTDITQTSQAERGTMTVFPLTKGKRTQKLALGDGDGVVQTIGMKNDERVSVFKTNPGPNPVSSLVLGQARTQTDKLFASTGNVVKGVNKKGKEFFKFTTNLTEPIAKLHVDNVTIWAAGEYVTNQYVNCADASYYMANDKVNDMAVASVILPDEKNPILGCADRFIRILQGSELYYEAATPGACTVVEHCIVNDRKRAEHNPEDKKAKAREVLYGTAQGGVGQIFLDGEKVRRGWVMDPKTSEAPSRAGISALHGDCDLTGDGVCDVVVGRDDGSLEVYTLDENGTPRIVFDKRLGESIQTLTSGKITSGFPEILVHTFSGKVIAFRPGADNRTIDGFAQGEQPTEHQMKMADDLATKRADQLVAEIESLKADVKHARGIYGNHAENMVAAGGAQRVLDKFTLNPDTACHHLTLEAPFPIYSVSVASTVPLDLLDVENDEAVCARSEPDPRSGTMALATYRTQGEGGASRAEIRLRVIEGHAGTVRAFMIPTKSPKTCTEKSYEIKTLCLHRRSVNRHEDEALARRPMNAMRISGDFAFDDAHAWIGRCLDEIPVRVAPPEAGGEIVYDFESALMGTLLRASVQEGDVTFWSDSVTPLALLKEYIGREATNLKLRVRFNFDLADATPTHFAELLHPKLHANRELTKQARLVEAMKEIKQQEETDEFFTEEQKQMLRDEDVIKRRLKEQPRELDYLIGVAKDFFVDWHRFKGVNVKHALPSLDAALRAKDYSLERLSTIFESGAV